MYGIHLRCYITLISPYTQYVKCKNCGTFLKHHKSHSGTTHLHSYLAVCSKAIFATVKTAKSTKQTRVTAYCKQANPSKSVKEIIPTSLFKVCSL